MSTIPESPSTGCLPESVVLRTTGGTIYDVLWAQRMESNTRNMLSSHQPVIHTYEDDDSIMGQDEYEDDCLRPPPDYDTDAGSD